MRSPISPASEAAARLRDIQSITDAALSHLDEQQFLAELLDRVRTVFGADTAAVLLLDRASGQLIATAASGLEEEVHQGVRLPVGRASPARSPPAASRSSSTGLTTITWSTRSCWPRASGR